jgi:hypothetical protein
MRFIACVVCRTPLEASSAKRTFCSNACRQRAYRRRKAGLPETFAARGRRDLGRQSLVQYHQGLQRVREAAAMGIDLKYDQVMLLLHR